jgi:organic radical activating enzyme
MKGYVKELFTSIQGEGIVIGQRQTFIRFLGCNLTCSYCDTPDAQKKEGCFVYQDSVFENPIPVDILLDKVTEGVVAITGGEPLLQIDFLQKLCEEISRMHKRIYLDTNATLPNELKKVINYVNTVALDFKIPTATGERQFWREHEQCLNIAVLKEVFVKVVINREVLPQEISTVCDIIERVDNSIPLVIQPVFGEPVSALLDIQKKALSKLTDVRIIPQIHKYLGLP